MTIDQKINQLEKGHSVEISRVGNVYVTAERSGDGSKVTFVRHNDNDKSWKVFRVATF